MTNATINQDLATNLMDQIGKRTFFMLGASNFIYSSENPMLSFRIKGSRAFNMIRIEGEPSDTYKITFINFKGINIKKEEVVEGVYADMLHKMIESKTGLFTSL